MVWFISVRLEWVSCWFRTWLKVQRYPKEVNNFFLLASIVTFKLFLANILHIDFFTFFIFRVSVWELPVCRHGKLKADVDVRYLFKLRKEVAPNQFGFFCSVVASYSDIEECAGISLLQWISIAKNEWLFGMYDCLAVISWDGHVIWRWVKGTGLSSVSVMEG